MELDAEAWTDLMDAVVADYQPGQVTPPGSGTEGDDPLGIKYADLGPLAYVLNEALDSAVNRGGDRDALLDEIANRAGEEVSRPDVDSALTGDNHNPARELLQAFADVLNIDFEILADAAGRGGGQDYKSVIPPPGY